MFLDAESRVKRALIQPEKPKSEIDAERKTSSELFADVLLSSEKLCGSLIDSMSSNSSTDSVIDQVESEIGN